MKRIIRYAILCFILLAGSDLVTAQNIDSLQREIEALRMEVKRVDELERRIDQIVSDSTKINFENAKRLQVDTSGKEVLVIPKSDLKETNRTITGSELVNDDFIGSWPMFGTDLRMKIGGYVKADVLYDFDGTTDRTQFLMSTIPVEGTPEYADQGYLYFMSKETRFNIDVRRITPGAVPLRFFLEGDFWATGSQFRLRHAYIVAGSFLVGQTWTTLSFLESLPFMIDFAAGDALFGGRTTQVRYQRSINSSLKIAVALEYLPYIGIENPNNLGGHESLQFPLLAMRGDYSWKTGLLLLGASVAQLYWDGGDSGPDARAMQFDAVVAGRQYVNTNNFFTWNISYGIGSGENIMAFSGSKANAVLNENGALDAIPAFALVLGYVHKWNEKLKSNLSYAYGWLDTPDSRSPYALKEGGVTHVNLVYSPVKSFSTGIEYMWGAQRVTNEAVGYASRIQVMAKFDF